MPSFQTRGGRADAADPYAEILSAGMPVGTAPPGGRELPAGFSLPPPPTKPQQTSAPAQQTSAPRPSDAARQAAAEQASARATAQAQAAHQEAAEALKTARQAQVPASASHAQSQAAAQVAAHAATNGVPREVPQNGPPVSPAGQVYVGPEIPIDQVYSQFLDPFAAFAPPVPTTYSPSGIYNPQAGVPNVTGNLSARVPTGSIGVGQITGQVLAGTPRGYVGGIYSGVTPAGIYGPTYGAGQANSLPQQQPNSSKSIQSSGTTPQQAWLNRIGVNADGWLDMTPTQWAYCLSNAGCTPDMMGTVIPAITSWCQQKTGRNPLYFSNGIQTFKAPAGQVIVAPTAPASSPLTSIVLLLGAAAAVGTYLYVTKEKKTAHRPARSRRQRYSASRLPAPRSEVP